MADQRSNDEELGALWQKEGRSGMYFTGQLEINGEKHKIVVFKNGNKKNDKAPDFRILRSKPKAEASDPPF